MPTLGTLGAVVTRSTGFAIMFVACGAAETLVRAYESALALAPWLDDGAGRRRGVPR
jgi:hypothetical protein